MISYTIFSTSPRVLGKTRAGWANPTRPATQPNPNRAGQPDPCRSLGEIPPPQRSISVRCRARVIITHPPSTHIACETHAMNRREVYCPPSVRGATPQISHKQAIADTNRGMGVNYRRYDS
jgi:hypothetical protein